MTCKALVDTLLDGDAAALGSYGARMAGVVFPGETLRVTAWKGDDGYVGNVTVPASGQRRRPRRCRIRSV